MIGDARKSDHAAFEVKVQITLDSQPDFATSDNDAQRRAEFRSFLKRCRSRLARTELGLPHTTRRTADSSPAFAETALVGIYLDEAADVARRIAVTGEP